MDHQNQPWQPCSLLMVAHCWWTRPASSIAGGKTSPTCSTDPRSLHQKPWTWYNKRLLRLALTYPHSGWGPKAVGQTSSGKAAGMDGIPAELFESVGPETLRSFYDILISIWEEESMPQEFKDATFISQFKNKGWQSDCGNYSGISLLSTAGKILARVILNRLISSFSDESLPEAQGGFRTGCSTVDMVVLVRQVQDKCMEQHMDIYKQQS